MRFNKISLAAMLVSGTILLAACGGGDDPAPTKAVVTTPVVAAINPTTGPTVVAAVLDKSFGFTSGVEAFGTTTPTTLKLSGTGATPSFNLSSAEGTATGAMKFGSCIFTIQESTYPLDSPLGKGKTVTVNPCSVTVSAVGSPADGTSSGGTATMTLGTTGSVPVVVTVTVSATGVVSVAGQPLGTATVVAGTGANN